MAKPTTIRSGSVPTASIKKPKLGPAAKKTIRLQQRRLADFAQREKIRLASIQTPTMPPFSIAAPGVPRAQIQILIAKQGEEELNAFLNAAKDNRTLFPGVALLAHAAAMAMKQRILRNKTGGPPVTDGTTEILRARDKFRSNYTPKRSKKEEMADQLGPIQRPPNPRLKYHGDIPGLVPLYRPSHKTRNLVNAIQVLPTKEPTKDVMPMVLVGIPSDLKHPDSGYPMSKIMSHHENGFRIRVTPAMRGFFGILGMLNRSMMMLSKDKLFIEVPAHPVLPAAQAIFDGTDQQLLQDIMRQMGFEIAKEFEQRGSPLKIQSGTTTAFNLGTPKVEKTDPAAFFKGAEEVILDFTNLFQRAHRFATRIRRRFIMAGRSR